MMPNTKSSRRKISVVVPCYEEALNVKPPCERLFKATRAAQLDAELLLIDDDSGAGTIATIKAVESLKKDDYNIAVHVRKASEGKGLSSAVLLGLRLASNEVICVMDADLQHEPESVPSLVAPILDGEAEFSIGCRYMEGGSIAEWSFFRRIVSIGATLLARPLTRVSDPMSGFFALSKQTLARGGDKINALGFKIGLEIMVRCECSNVKEVPISFQLREEGESKLTKMQYVYYVLHLLNLYWFCYPKMLVFTIFIGMAIAYFILDVIVEHYM